ncbi:MAG TPA: hypothetical protein VEQ38_26695, partial [Verrucomicrobiae bacterium]|nr:hypothetical protein [Verrucomicrobiae bacterium]
ASLINLIEGAPTPTEKGYVLPQSDKPMSIENHKNFKEPRAVCHLARSTGRKITSLSLPAVSGLAALHTLRAKVGSSAVNYVFAAHKFCVKRIFLILFA